jgi:hypothetical protein
MIAVNFPIYRTKFNSEFRKYINARPRLLKAARTLNFMVRLGPWREIVIAALCRFGKNRSMAINDETLFPALDVSKALLSIVEHGYSVDLNLPPDYLKQIIDCGKLSEKKSFFNPHHQCELIGNIVRDPKIIEVARLYLGTEPILWGSRIYWSYPDVSAGKNVSAPRKKEFHFDAGDFKSLSLFIYLTDVEPDCGPHVMIENTHGRKSLKQILNPLLPGETAEEIYGDRIKILTGKRGFGFFEDLSCYHQHSIGSKPRLVLTASYLLHRRPPVTL